MQAVYQLEDAELIAGLSEDLGEAMVGINEQEIDLLMAQRGIIGMSANERGASPTIAVLALQGACAEHEAMLAKLGVRWMELREAGDLHKEFDALILPGGESTVQAKLLEDLGMLAPLKARIEGGMPVLGTCAGAILLAERIDEGKGSGYDARPFSSRLCHYADQGAAKRLRQAAG